MGDEPKIESEETTTPSEETTSAPETETETETESEETTEGEETLEEAQTRATKAEEFAKQSLGRAKKAEGELKKAKPSKTPETPATPQVSPQEPGVEETVLLAGGMHEDLLIELKAIAKVRDVSLIKAQTDPIFVAMKEQFEKDQKQKEVSLGASRGSGTPAPKKDASTPNLSREEHKKIAMDAMENPSR